MDTPAEGLNWKQIAVIDKKDITSNLINGFEIVDIGRDELICSRNGDIVDYNLIDFKLLATPEEVYQEALIKQ